MRFRLALVVMVASLAFAAPARAAWRIDGAQNDEGAYQAPATITLSAEDAGSGVCFIYYSLDGAAEVASADNPTVFTVTAEGSHTVAFFAEDCAGNRSGVEAFDWTQSSAAPTPAPPTVSLAAEFANLVYYGPRLGQPAQRLFGTVGGGAAGAVFTVEIVLTEPDGEVQRHSLTTAAGDFEINAAASGDPYFGTTETGTWLAQAEVSAAGIGTATSNNAVWDVEWYPVNQQP